MPTVPSISAADREAALNKALETRRARAEVKAQLKSGELSAADALARRDDPVIGKIPVTQFIKCFPGWGPTKTAKLLQQLNISDTRRLAGLGDRQVADLIETLS